MKIFPTNFISANLYAKSYFCSCQKQNHTSYPYIIIKFNELRTKLFSSVTFIIYTYNTTLIQYNNAHLTKYTITIRIYSCNIHMNLRNCPWWL